MANTNTITIQFGAKGDKDVINAINKLDRSTQKLISTQKSIIDSNKNNESQSKKTSNAMQRMDIRLKALDSSFRKAQISEKLLTQAHKGDRVAIEKVRIAVNKYIATQKKAEVSTRILGGSLAVLRSKLLIVNFALGLGIRQMSKMVTRFAKVESMERAFNTLAGATEDSTQSLIKLRKATNNTMSEFDLFQQANNAMILGVADNSETMAEMFDIAQRLGRALGRDTASSVESLITGIGRQSRLMLDNIGIIVKSEEAYEDYAKKLGVTTDSLTDAQKKQAFLEATMESARKKIESLGEETLSAQDNFDQLATSMDKLANAVSKRFAPLFANLAKNMGEIADSTAEFLDPTVDRQAELNKLLAEYTKLTEKVSDAEFTGPLLPTKELELQSSTVDEIFSKLSNMEEFDELTAGLSTDHMKEGLQVLRDQILEYKDLLAVKNIDLEITRSNQESEINTGAVIERATSNGIVSYNELLKVKKENLQQDIRGAMLSGQSAKDAMKTVVKAEAMEAVAGYIASVLKNVPFPVNVVLAAGGGAVVSGLLDKGLAEFEQGGLVGGQRHSQGGTIIEAEQGEFVMSRQAVQSVGLETMNQINQGNGGGLTINVSAPLVDETILDVIIPQIQKAQRQNLA